MRAGPLVDVDRNRVVPEDTSRTIQMKVKSSKSLCM